MIIRKASGILFFVIFFSSCIYRGKNDTSSLMELLLSAYRPRSVLIIGDSLTVRSGGFFLKDYLSPESSVSFRGIESADFLEWSYRLSEAFHQESLPDQAVIVLGTNDAYRFTSAVFLSNVNIFHSQLALMTNAQIFYSLVPESNDPQLAVKIKEQNNVLRLNPPRGISGLIDFESAFLNSSIPLYTIDPIHPNEDGYRLMGITISRAVSR